MRFLSLFSGIEAASEAWLPLGWECAGVSEIDPFACAVLAHRHPHVPNLGDITKITEMQIAALGHIDLIVFGSPCQDLSVAGKQKGLSGERSGLFYPAVDIINWARLWCGARFALWENVPGAFSSNQGRDFAAVVGTLAGLDDIGVPPKGWGTEGCAVGSEAMVEWATLDAQWFGVAQRRRRIFALADFGNWAGRPPILLEPEGVRGDSAPSREAGQGIARGFTTGPTGGGFTDTAPTLDCRCKNGPVQNQVGLGVIQSVRRPLTCPAEVCCTLDTTFGAKQGLEDQHVNAGCPMFVPSAHVGVVPACTTADRHGVATVFDPNQVTSPTNRSNPQPGAACHTLPAKTEPPIISYTTKLHNTGANNAGKIFEERTTCLDANSPPPALLTAMQVRRLTPVECERLQGFPDGHTDIPWTEYQRIQKLAAKTGSSFEAELKKRGKVLRGPKTPACPDGPRYKALGNSMAVPVMRWIGQKIDVALLFQE